MAAGAVSARCYACEETLPVGEFAPDRWKASGRASICRACDREKARAYYAANQAAVLAKQRERGASQSAAAGPRLCKVCREPSMGQQFPYCAACRPKQRGEKLAAQRRQRPTTTALGYGAPHKALRAFWAPKVATGTVVCARPGCGKVIAADAPWDLGHGDFDRSVYHGPEHRRCNRRAAALKRQGRLERQPAVASARKW